MHRWCMCHECSPAQGLLAVLLLHDITPGAAASRSLAECAPPLPLLPSLLPLWALLSLLLVLLPLLCILLPLPLLLLVLCRALPSLRPSSTALAACTCLWQARRRLGCQLNTLHAGPAAAACRKTTAQPSG